MWVRILLLSLVALLLSKSAEAKVYRCEGASGTTILTDQPKGKRGCVVVATTSPSPPGGYTPTGGSGTTGPARPPACYHAPLRITDAPPPAHSGRATRGIDSFKRSVCAGRTGSTTLLATSQPAQSICGTQLPAGLEQQTG